MSARAYPVVVVGGGPAGLATSCELRRRGPAVLPRPAPSSCPDVPFIGFHMVDEIRAGLELRCQNYYLALDDHLRRSLKVLKRLTARLAPRRRPLAFKFRNARVPHVFVRFNDNSENVRFRSRTSRERNTL